MNKRIVKTLFIYLKSLIDLVMLGVSQLFSTFRDNLSNSILFINTGQIGDLVVSSALFENDKVLNGYKNVYFLIRKEYLELFVNYKGPIKIIEMDRNLYKYNYFYRLKFNSQLKKHRIKIVYNLTSARATWNDTLALGIGAKEKYCYENNWKSVKKVFTLYTDKLYTNKIAKNFYNEYEKMDYLIASLSMGQERNYFLKTNIFLSKKNYEKFDVIVAPLSSAKIKNWSLDNFQELLSIISRKWKILLVGSVKQEMNLIYLKNRNTNIMVSAGKTRLNELYGLIQKSKLYIGLDSGISHIALKAINRNIILLGGGTYGKYFPIPKDNSTVYLVNKVSCFQCEWECKKKMNYCLADISVYEVLKHVNKLLNS